MNLNRFLLPLALFVFPLNQGTPEPGWLLIVNRSSHTVVAVDPIRLEVVTTWPTGVGPQEVAVSPDGAFAYVANRAIYPEPHDEPLPLDVPKDWVYAQDSTITVIDVKRRRVDATWSLAPYSRPHGLWPSRDGQRLWVTAEDQHTLLELDTATGTITQVWNTPEAAHMVTATPDDAKLYLANTRVSSITVIDRQRGTMRTIETGRSPEGFEMSPDGRELWIPNRADNTISILDVATDRVLETIPTHGSFSLQVAFTPDGREVWVSNNNSNDLTVLDAQTRELIGRIPLGTQPLGLLVAPDGKHVYATLPRANSVAVIDAQRKEIVTEIRTGIEPDGLAWASAARHRPYLDAARDAAAWLQAQAVETPDGRAWPVDAHRPGDIQPDLGDGTAGVILFFKELYRVTGEDAYLAEARAGADYLVNRLPALLASDGFPPRSSFYYGLGGIVWMLHEMYRLTGTTRYQTAALQIVETLHADADAGSWGRFNDLLFGDAGTGLFLLYAAREMSHAPSLDLAKATGHRLINEAHADSAGLYWTFAKDNDRVLPNFSHGNAGIGYFLASLYEATGDAAFLEAAVGAAQYLHALADTTDGRFLVKYGLDNPDWDFLDVGWAHGGAGTARFFYQLAQVTGDGNWMHSVEGSVHGLRQSGLPGAPAPGFGNHPFYLDRRFGIASVADFFLRLYEASGPTEHYTFGKNLVDHVLAQATRDDAGLRWPMERYAFMTEPGEPAVFTGYFYGAAGYGLLLLHLDAIEQQTTWPLRLPDAPF